MDGHLTLLIGPGAPGTVTLTALRGDAAGLSAAVWRGSHAFDARQVEVEGQALLRAARRAQTQPADRGADALVAHGRLLFDLLLPAPIKQILRAEAGTLLLAPGPLASVPWPLLHDGAETLGRRWALGEVMDGAAGLHRPPAPSREGRLLVVADPAGDLPAARFEGEALMSELATELTCDLRMGRLRRADFLRIFKSFRLVHLAGHADGPEATRPGGWRFTDGWVGAADLASLAGEAAPLMVFANACRSAEVPDLVPALLHAGVRLVIATVLDLPDLPGADFAIQVYRGLLEGAGTGEALRRARQAAAEAGSMVWAAYRLFGDPRTVCLGGRGVAQWDAGVRQAVVLAARVAFQASEPEGLAEEMQRFREDVGTGVEAAGGRLLPGHTSITRAVFGLPLGHEDDVERAARAALAVAERMPGAVITLEAGPLTAVGQDGVGPAALAAEAACWSGTPGVWVLPGAARRLQRRARVEERDGASPGRRLLGLLPPGALPDPPLVGRVAELARLEAEAAAVLAGGRQRGVTMLGPAGQGKSRLLVALAERIAPRFQVVVSAGASEAPFAPVVPLLRRLLRLAPDAGGPALVAALERLEGQAPDDFLLIDDLLAGETQPTLRDRAPALAAVLGVSAEGMPGPAPDPAAVPVAVREVVVAAARQGPVAFLVEDLHLLSDAALAVVDELMLGTGNAPVWVVGTGRSTLLERRPRWGEGSLRLELAPLPAAEALAVLDEVLPPEVALEERRALVARAEGNPLFLRELGLARAQGTGADVPPTVEAVFQARVDRQPPLERQVLRAAAIFGPTFWLRGVQRLLGLDAGVEGALEALARSGLVAPEPGEPGLVAPPRWRFAHTLLQAAVVQAISPRARRAWHARAALWLAEEAADGGTPAADHHGRIAYHQSEAGDPARATESWLRAAAVAEARLAPAEAASALTAALAEDDRAAGALGPTRRAATEQALAERRRADGDLVGADGLLDAAVARDLDPVPRAERLRRRAEVDEARGELAAARSHLAEARALLEALPDVGGEAGAAVEVVIERDEAWLAWRDGRSAEAVDRLTALRARLPDGHGLIGPVHNALGVVAYGRGEHIDAQRHYQQALAAFELVGDLPKISSAYNNLGILAMRQGDLHGAEAWFKRGLRIKAEGGDREGLARAYNNLGTVYGELADYPRAARYLAEAIRIRERSGHAGLAVSYANLGEVFLKQGQLEAARDHLERALAQCRAGRGPAYLLPDVGRMLAELLLASAQPEAASQVAREAMETALKSGDGARAGVASRVLGEALTALEDATADAAFQAAVDRLQAEPIELARALEARARAWRGAAAVADQLRLEARQIRAQLATP